MSVYRDWILPSAIEDWPEVWLVVDPEEGTIVFGDEKSANADAAIYRENSGGPTFVLGPFKPTKRTKVMQAVFGGMTAVSAKAPKR